MHDPVRLHQLSLSEDDAPREDNIFPLTWGTPGTNIGTVNISGAREHNKLDVDLSVAIHPSNIHPRMSAQKKFFTILVKKKRLNELISPELIKKYLVNPIYSQEMLKELRMLGITNATIFPELGGFSRELEESF